LKKLVIISLLGIFLFNTAGYYVVFLAEQMQIRNEIRSQINSGYYDKSFTSVITVNKTALSNVEFFDDGNEMIYNGARYDITKKTETDSEVTLYCINDLKEESLFASLDKHIDTHVAANKPLKDNSSKKITDNIVKVYFTPVTTFNFYRTAASLNPIPAGNDCLPAEKQKSTPPPPEFC
jgi:hypothetical protein